MQPRPPLVVDLPPMSDKSIFEIHRFLGILLAAIESDYDVQLRRYYDRYPQHERPATLEDDPF